MKTLVTLLISVICLLPLPGKAFQLSNEAEISILTCSPGKELYSLFGHTAIRVQDPKANLDEVFNYGTFDFDTPHFYLKFAQGLLPYQLSTSSFQHFMYTYQLEERSVYSQRLLLDSLQKQQLFDLLLENYRPENRSYLYNFLFDNCTTRARDIIAQSLQNSQVEWNTPDLDKNFWNLLDEYLAVSPWVQWGIHTILGQRGNRTATPYQYMFLPDYLMYGLNTATIDHKHLAEKAQLLYEAPEQDNATPWYFAPLFIFGIGVDYSIFVMNGLVDGGKRPRLLEYHKTAIFFSAVILIVTVGSMLLAVHPAIRSVGFSTLTGLVAAVVLSYVMQPAVYRWLERRKSSRKD